VKLLAGALLALATQAADAPQPMPPAFGTLASKLTAYDYKEINRLSTRMGGSIWVMFGDTGLLSNNVWGVEVHKKPAILAGGIRTGEVVWVAADLKPDQSARVWRLDGVGVSAQVPLAGRDPDEVTSDMDVNRPFRVHGRWSAEELAVLVGLIRSSPPSINPKQGLPSVDGKLPIYAVWREGDDTAQVALRLKARESHRVQLARQGGSWVVTLVSLVIFD
jgi:hypothetical protein